MSNGETQILLLVACPGCKISHSVAVPRLWLKNELDGGRDVRLYCVRSDASWSMTEEEKANTRKAFAEGIL